MSALESLIRLHRWQTDERKRHLADLEALAAKLREEQRRLALEDEREQAAASASPDAAYAYAGYAHGLIERRRKLLQSLAEIDGQVAKASEALAEAFQEVKRYEITAATRLRQQQLREQKRQQRTLDELGVETYRRRTNGR